MQGKHMITSSRFEKRQTWVTAVRLDLDNEYKCKCLLVKWYNLLRLCVILCWLW